jgi:DNA-binding GntR family transcriptional regulator
VKKAEREDLGEGQRAFNELSREIVEGRLEPGARLVEADLSARMGLSRTPLREALFRLEREGLVRTELRRGFSVSPLSEREARETYSIVAALESFGLRQSLLVEPLVPRLREANKRLWTARKNPYRAVIADKRFHECLLERCPNQRLIILVAGLHQHVERYELLYMSDESLIGRSFEQHNEIIKALAHSDIDGACRALHDNYEFGVSALAGRLR